MLEYRDDMLPDTDGRLEDCGTALESVWIDDVSDGDQAPVEGRVGDCPADESRFVGEGGSGRAPPGRLMRLLRRSARYEAAKSVSNEPGHSSDQRDVGTLTELLARHVGR